MAKKRNLLLPIILLILLAAACGAAGKLYIDHRAAEKALAQAEAELDASRTMLAELEQSLAAVRSERDDCAAQLDALERKLSGVDAIHGLIHHPGDQPVDAKPINNTIHISENCSPQYHCQKIQPENDFAQ